MPGPVSVVGFDGIFGSDFCHPPLTTVTSAADRAGRELVDLLLEQLDGRPARQIVLPTQLRVRDSTSSPTKS